MAMELKRWSLEELHSLPDDGNKYELIRGELFVTPAPRGGHESILAALSAQLTPYVVANGLGMVYHPRAVFRFEGSEVEPDLMVRRPWGHANPDWANAPLPLLVVEVHSESTRRRDREHKRRLYLDARIPEYWMLDPDERSATIVRPYETDRLVRDELVWYPEGVEEPLRIALADVFVDCR